MNTPATENCYDFPQYWDLAFRSETTLEAQFFEQAFQQYCDKPVRRLLEPGCGGGRLVVEMASRGYDVTGFDLSAPAIRYLSQRLKRRRLSGTVFVGDMTQFELDDSVDAAFNTFNTFRHLTTEDAARQHLQSVARCVRPGGLYVLGFHLLPLDADPECRERWTAHHAGTKVTVSLRVLDSCRRKRIERVRFNLLARRQNREIRLRTDYELRMYTAGQFRSLLRSTPEWELCDVFDFWYEIDMPLPLDDEISDSVFILRRA